MMICGGCGEWFPVTFTDSETGYELCLMCEQERTQEQYEHWAEEHEEKEPVE